MSEARPLGGRLTTVNTVVLAVLSLIAVWILVQRFMFGLGAVSAGLLGVPFELATTRVEDLGAVALLGRDGERRRRAASRELQQRRMHDFDCVAECERDFARSESDRHGPHVVAAAVFPVRDDVRRRADGERVADAVENKVLDVRHVHVVAIVLAGKIPVLLDE